MKTETSKKITEASRGNVGYWMTGKAQVDRRGCEMTEKSHEITGEAKERQERL